MSAEIPPEEQERLARELADQLRQLRVEDVLVNALMTISSIGFRRLGLTEDAREDRDFDQTRLAIETMQALTPVLARFLPADLVRDFNASVANLQLAYAKAASPSASPPPRDAAEEDTSDEAPEDTAGAGAEEVPEEDAPESGTSGA